MLGLRFGLMILIAASALANAPAAVGQEGSQAVDFGREIQPLLAKRCFACHGPDKNEGGLRLHQSEASQVELDSGERAIVAHEPDASALLARVSSEDESIRMPPEGEPLTAEQIDALRRWIAEGAEYKVHWAFLPLSDPSPPEVKDASWLKNPIDAFILHKLEEKGLAPAPAASPQTLIRRMTFDVTGLPPKPEETEAFVAEYERNREAAIEALIGRLLDSPHYGERWARHWLDLVRFAETNSFERDGPKPNAWRYRDYVIKSFNDDKPYDQFLREQLAGDELDSVSTETIVATGYYRLGIWDDEPADPLQARFDEFDDIVSTTGQVMLGLTVNCARCHDHKIDPIPQADYYQLVAFFRDISPYGTRGDQRSFNQTDISPPEVREAHERIDREQRELETLMAPIAVAGIQKMSAEDQRKTEGPERERVLREKLQGCLSEEEWRVYSEAKAKLDDLRREQRRLPRRESALSVADTEPRPEATHVLFRGSPHDPRDEVAPGFPSLFGDAPPDIPPVGDGAKSAGRRRVLADWITAPENRLTSRVMANRLWQHHFGRGIVRSSNNFGQLGTPPTHPELLDWLASEFVRSDWSMKHVHKLILSSSAYQMSSQPSEQALALDPMNELFSRFDMRRLSAEELRDAIIAVTGKLNPKMYGPGIFPKISKEVLAGQSQPGSGWGESSPEESARRSVYIHVKRSLVTPLLSTFDFPETDASCEARFATTQPSQALSMLNSEFLHEQATVFAERLLAESDRGKESLVSQALELALSRPATEAEIARGLSLLDKLKSEHKLDDRQALVYYCLVLYNLNEFLFLD
jgi:mono/diheme cytochrome c family protein